MAQITDIKLPKINTDELSNEKYVKKITNYLLSLEENMRYMFGNIDEDNITDHFIKTLTVGNLRITNGVNSIIGNPDDGFKMLKDQKVQFSFDINTGIATFGGKMIGGSIESDNYFPGYSGMKIDLTDGTLSTAKFKLLPDGSIDAVGGRFSGTIEGPQIKSVYLSANGVDSGTMEMSDTSFSTYRTVDGVRDYSGEYNFQGFDVMTLNDYYQHGYYGYNTILLENVGGTLFLVDRSTLSYKGSSILTKSNLSSLINTYDIPSSVTPYGNIKFSGSVNAAGVTWVETYFAAKDHVHSGYAASVHSHDYATQSQIDDLWIAINAL